MHGLCARKRPAHFFKITVRSAIVPPWQSPVCGSEHPLRQDLLNTALMEKLSNTAEMEKKEGVGEGRRMHSMTKIQTAFTLLSLLVLSVAGGGRAAAAPPAPIPLAPADTATVQIPFAISWSAVSDPAGIVAYNWQVSPSSSFTPVVLQNSTSGPTQDTVS